MLEYALRARLPLITCTTRDPLSTANVLRHLADKASVKRSTIITPKSVPSGATLYAVGAYKIAGGAGKSVPFTIEQTERHFLDKGISLVVVNPIVNPAVPFPPNFFDAGEMPTPKTLVDDMLASIVEDGETEGLWPALGGLTLKEVNWLVRLASAKSGEVTCESLTNARKTAFPARQGLEQVDTDMPFYLRSAKLEAWISMELPFLLGKEVDLRPRGILCAGPPGTGKTMAAKRIAEKLGVPLYRFDLAGVMNKYIGETEKAIAQALAQADREAPCVFLIDEVEKVFAGTGGSGDHGLTSKVLASLLWWLQEHESRVLTVMTTNDKNALPPELYRPGRIDDVLYLNGVTFTQARALGAMIAAKYPHVPLTKKEIVRVLNDLWGDNETSHSYKPQAEIISALTKCVKALILDEKTPKEN